MKLLHVVPTYLPAVRHGGPIRAVHGLAKALVARGHEVTVFTTNQHGAGKLDVPTDRPVDIDGVGVRYFPTAWPRRMARSPAMKRALEAAIGGVDVVHLHSLFLWPTAAAARTAERAGVPWLVSPRGMLVRELFRQRGRLRKTLWLRLSERRTLSGAARILVTSPLEEEEARHFGLRLPPVELLPNGVDRVALPPSPETLPAEWRALTADGLLFVYLGRLSWKKGLDRLVEAVASLPGAQLALAGNDEEGIGPRLEELAARLGASPRVHLVGFVDGERKSALVAAARALVLPSISENFGNVVLEAWALGVPVVVSPGVGLAAEVAEAGGGLVAGPEAAGLVAALAALAGDPERARDMGERGRRRASERFSWEAIAERAEAIYATVIDERRRDEHRDQHRGQHQEDRR